MGNDPCGKDDSFNNAHGSTKRLQRDSLRESQLSTLVPSNVTTATTTGQPISPGPPIPPPPPSVRSRTTDPFVKHVNEYNPKFSKPAQYPTSATLYTVPLPVGRIAPPPPPLPAPPRQVPALDTMDRAIQVSPMTLPAS